MCGLRNCFGVRLVISKFEVIAKVAGNVRKDLGLSGLVRDSVTPCVGPVDREKPFQKLLVHAFGVWPVRIADPKTETSDGNVFATEIPNAPLVLYLGTGTISLTGANLVRGVTILI